MKIQDIRVREDCPSGYIYMINPKYLKLQPFDDLIYQIFKKTGRNKAAIILGVRRKVNKKVLQGVITNIKQ